MSLNNGNVDSYLVLVEIYCLLVECFCIIDFFVVYLHQLKIMVMKTCTFTSKIYRCSVNQDGTVIYALLEVKDITLSDLSIGDAHSFVCAYVRGSRSNGHYFVETSYNRGRTMTYSNLIF